MDHIVWNAAGGLARAGYEGAEELVEETLIPMAEERGINLLEAAQLYANQDAEQDTSQHELFYALQKLSFEDRRGLELTTFSIPQGWGEESCGAGTRISKTGARKLLGGSWPNDRHGFGWDMVSHFRIEGELCIQAYSSDDEPIGPAIEFTGFHIEGESDSQLKLF